MYHTRTISAEIGKERRAGTIDFWIMNSLNGIVFGFILFILATGFTLIFGVMGIVNFAHGAIFMIGAYLGWTLAADYGSHFGLAILAGGIGCGLIGLVLHQGFLRYLHMQINEQILLTAGFMFIFTNLVQWIFGPIARSPFTPPMLVGSLTLLGLTYPLHRITVIIIGVIIYVALWWLLEKTRIGAIVRAGMDDKEMAMGLGINVHLVNIAVFSFGTFITGIAGVIGIQLLGADLELSLFILKFAMVVVVVGGVGSVHGALLGSLLIGFIDAFGKALFPELAMFTIFLAMIVILLIKPRGLLGRKGIWG